jgi:TonB-dependent receptor
MTILKSRCAGVSAAVLAAVLSAGAAQAQHQVSGRVADTNGAPLPGARISVPELGLSATTGRQGEFSFPSLPAGEMRLVIDYLGFPTSERGVNVAPDARNTIEIILSSAVNGVETIVVRGSILDGQARALNQQRTALNTTNVVSSDAIGRFPDANIAEALQRVPGFGVERDQGEGRYINLRGAPSEFTSITVDGTSLGAPEPATRAVDLDTIPSDAVSAIEVSKTLLPRQEADSIAGAVNLVTRSPFDRPGLRISGQGGMSYNDYGGTNDQRGSFVVSNTFGPGERFGLLLSGSHSRTDRRVDNFESIWDVVERPEGGDVFAVVESEIKDYDTRRTRQAVTGTAEFRPDDANRFFLRGSYSKFEDDELRNLLVIVYDDGSLQPGATDTTATWSNARIEKELRRRIVTNEISTLAAGAEHDFGGFELDYTLSFSRAEQTYPSRNQLKFRSTLRPTISYDYANPDFPFVSLFETGEHLDLSAYGFRENTFRGTDTVQDEIAFRANLSTRGNLFGQSATHQGGVSLRFRDVESDEFRFRDRRSSTGAITPSIQELISDRPSQNFDYFLGNKIDHRLAGAYWSSVAQISTEDEVLRVPQSVEADYQAEENIYSAYGMTTLDMGATTVIAGLRVERTELEARGFRLDGSASSLDEVSLVTATNDYTSWFPNLTVRHAFSDNLIGRFALTRGIARPNYPDVAPRIVETGDGNTVNVRLGNPQLNPTLANNIDAGLEYYIEPLGVVSASVFYKDLQDYEYELRSTGEFEGVPAFFRRPENADGRLFGYEINYVQQFDFLPGMLSGFGALANYTWTDAEIDVGQPIAGRSAFPLPGQSRESMNLAVFYETDRFNARLSWTNRTDYLDAIDADNPDFDLWWEGREQLDFTAAYEVTNQFEVFFEAKNLTDTPGIRYFGSRERVYEIEKFGYSLFAGVRFNY